jgi:hypothetical protein
MVMALTTNPERISPRRGGGILACGDVLALIKYFPTGG